MRKALKSSIAMGVPVIGMVMGMVAAPVNAYAGTSAKTTVTILAPSDTSLDPVWEAQTKLFEKQHPDIQVKWDFLPWNNMWAKQASEMLVNKLQDIYLINSTGYASGNLQYMIQKDKAAPITKYVNVKDLKLQPQFTAPATYKGQLYAMPFESFASMAYLDVDLFKKYHIPVPNANWTAQDEIKIEKEFLAKAKKTGEKINTSLGWAMFDDRYASEWTGYKEYYLDKAGKAPDLTTNPRLLKFFRWSLEAQQLVPPAGSFPSSWATQFGETAQPIFQDQSYATGAVMGAANFKVKVLPWPKGLNQYREFTGANYWVINSQSKVAKAAAEFLHFIDTPAAAKLYVAQGKFAPVNTLTNKDYEFSIPTKDKVNKNLMVQVAKVQGEFKASPPDRNLPLYAKGLSYDTLGTIWTNVVGNNLSKNKYKTWSQFFPDLQKAQSEMQQYVNSLH